MNVAHHKRTRDSRNLFSVHIGNVPWDTEEEELMKIFQTVSTHGPPVINIVPFQETCFTTYAFVRYRTQREADDAVRKYDGVKFGEQILHVTISNQSKSRMEVGEETKNPHGISKFSYNRSKSHGVSKWKYEESKKEAQKENQPRGRPRARNRKYGPSILRAEMPRREPNGTVVNSSDEKSINCILRGNLRNMIKNKEIAESYDIDDPREFLNDFRDVCELIADVPYGVSVNPIRFGAEDVKKSDIEDLLVRFYGDWNRDIPFKNVDVDVSSNKLLDNEQMESLFPCLK